MGRNVRRILGLIIQKTAPGAIAAPGAERHHDFHLGFFVFEQVTDIFGVNLLSIG